MTSDKALKEIKTLMDNFEAVNKDEFERMWRNTTIGELKETWAEINDLIASIKVNVIVEMKKLHQKII